MTEQLGEGEIINMVFDIINDMSEHPDVNYQNAERLIQNDRKVTEARVRRETLDKAYSGIQNLLDAPVLSHVRKDVRLAILNHVDYQRQESSK